MKRAAFREVHAVLISTTPRPVAGCSGKRCYETKSVAARLAKQTRRQRDVRVGEYRCRNCHFWHIGEL